MTMKRIALICLVGLSAHAKLQAALLAEVRTSAGNFSINLDYINAPRTVSHFMHLASGKQAWLNTTTGKIVRDTPFYDGLTFYKKLDQAVPLRKYIQTGARNNMETDDAGYTLRDEIRYEPILGGLLIPHGQWTVTMANRLVQSGTLTLPHTGSSQFLISLVNDSSFDGKNSAFGFIETQFVEYNGNGVPIGVTNGRVAVLNIFSSATPVTIQSITFRRTDPAAVAFDETAALTELPEMRHRVVSSVSHDATNVTLTHEGEESSEVRAFRSLDLVTWSSFPNATSYVRVGETAPSSVTIPHGGFSEMFYRLSSTEYPVDAVPRHLFGTIVFVGLGTPEYIRFDFDPLGTNHTYYRFSDGATGVLLFDYTPVGPFTADLMVTSPGLGTDTLYRLYFGGSEVTPSNVGLMEAYIFRAFQPGIDSSFSITVVP